MDSYTAFKFLHVAFAIAWLGGGLTMVILGVLAERARDEARLRTVVEQVVLAAHRVFIPSTGLVLLFGLLMVWTGGYGWGEAWIVLGFLGILVTGGLGALLLTPLAERVARLGATPGQGPEAAAAAHRLIAVAKFDMTMLFSIVLVMVAKPSWGDWPLLAALAAIVALAALAFLRPERRAALPA